MDTVKLFCYSCGITFYIEELAQRKDNAEGCPLCLGVDWDEHEEEFVIDDLS